MASEPLREGASAVPIRVFIGTEPRQWIAEAVLRYSIEHHCTREVRISSMDASLGGTWSGWEIGRRPDSAPTARVNELGQAVWYTGFTNFRWAIPEVCGFEGRAIYFDVDMLVLGDVAELASLPMEAAALSLLPEETSVMLMDCAAFARIPGWPRIEQMKRSGLPIQHYAGVVHRHGGFGQLPPQWNCLDGRGFTISGTRLVHFTDMATQPWRPLPERFVYHAHPVPEVERLWFHYARAAGAAGYLRAPRVGEIVPVATSGRGG